MNPTAKPCELTQIADCRDFFQQMILSGLSYWQDHAALQNMDVPILDKERDGILHALSHGLDFDQAWPLAQKLIKALASYMERRGYWTAWRSVLEQAIATSQRVGDLAGETTMTALLARLSQRQSRGADVVRYYRRAMRLAKQSDNQYEYARACCNLGYYYIDAFRWWRAEVLSLRALAIFEALGSEHGQAHTHNHLGMLYTRMECWTHAQTNLERACRLWRSSDDQHGLLSGQLNLGLMHIEKGTITEAMDSLHGAHRIAQRTGELSNTARIWNNMAVAHQKNAAWQEAEECAKKAESLFQEYGDERGLASAWENLGTIYIGINQNQRAATYFGNALTIQRKYNNQTEIKRIHAAMSAL